MRKSNQRYFIMDKIEIRTKLSVYKVITTVLLLLIFILMGKDRVNALNIEQVQLKRSFPAVISYQGTLLNQQGEPIHGQVDIVFRLYAHSTDSAFLWEENHIGQNAVIVTNGLFNLVLGSLSPIPESVWDEGTLYLGITVGIDEEMMPREVISSVPYAINAQNALNLSDNSITGQAIIDGSLFQEDAPTLIKSANGENEIIRSGNSVFAGSDSEGKIEIAYPCFPNGVRVFLAMNGHWTANHSQVVGNNGSGQCTTTVIVSPPTSTPIRINWIAIGN